MARRLLILAVVSLACSASPATSATVARPGTLVFVSQRVPGYGLYAESAAGGSLRQLRTGVEDVGVVWSRDGRHFLFQVSGTPPWEPQLWISDTDGRHRHVVALNAGQPTWAPDGRRIAFIRNGAIWIARPDGKRAHRVTNPGKGYDGSPRWSPNGSLIAFLRANPPGTATGSRLMAVQPTGTGLRRIAYRVFFPPSWSPDGKRIAFDSSGPRDIGSFEPHLYTAGPADQHRQQLTDTALSGFVAWSPNGRWIAFNGEGTNAVSIVHPDGGGLRPLFTGTDAYSAPVWAPDSRRLAVVSGRPSDIWVVGLDGHALAVTEGSRYGYSSYSPSWQPRNLPPQRLGGRVVSPAIPTDSVVAGGVLKATRPIKTIAADGARVAIQYGPGPPAGGELETWDAPSGPVIRFNMGGYQGPALAGDRVAVPVFEHALGTNSYGVSTATTGTPNPTWVGGLCTTGTSGFCIRDPLGDVVGKGSLLVFDSWKGPEPYCNDPCPPTKREGRLFRVDNGSAVQIAASSAELTPLAVDGDRVLVDEGSGTLAVLDSTGAELTEVAAPGFTEASLQGSDLVAHDGITLDDYDSTSGGLLHSWPVPADATLEDLQGGVAVYVTDGDIHLLRLSDGRDAVITPPATDPLLVRAQLEAAGLFYSYTVEDPERPGRVAFVPSAALP